MTSHDGVFHIACCGKRRGIFPGGVLICPRCDFTEVSVMPNERHAKDVRPDATHWAPERSERA